MNCSFYKRARVESNIVCTKSERFISKRKIFYISYTAAGSTADHVKYQSLAHALASILSMFTVKSAVGTSPQWNCIFPAVVTLSA